MSTELRKDVNPELAMKAAEAWKLMTRTPNILDALTGREPMPPAVALDFVQNVTGDRDDAVTALLCAAAEELAGAMPVEDAPGDVFASDARACVYDLRGECLSHAGSMARTIEIRASDLGAGTLAGVYRNVPHWPRVSVFEDWRRWAQHALESIAVCRRVVAEAYPEPAA